jgi:hypothetical protein
MTDRAPHPDFLAAPDANRWAGTLPQLAEKLKHEAYAAKGEWAWRVLPGGALVAMRVPPTFVKELRIARRLRKPFTEKSAKAWRTELATFVEQLGCTGWKCTSDVLTGDAGEQQKVEAIYQEPAPLGAKSNTATCAKCGNEFEPRPTDKLYREYVCNPCAFKLGSQEADERRATRGATP